MAKEKKTVFIHQPQFKGGPKELTKFIYDHLRYPKEALEAGVEGTVYIEYDVDYQGNVVAARVIQGIGHGCDEEACRVVQMLKFDVERNRGVHVLFHQKVKVVFKKPKPVPQPLPNMQVAYTVTTTAPKPEQKPAETTYSYTIKL
ncbi:MAG: energy transducer TonB [Saprospiraceae bacterium]|nr:energy transducer TonB [Saprospiraceae bacterium]